MTHDEFFKSKFTPVATSTIAGAAGGLIGTFVAGPLGGLVGGAIGGAIPSLVNIPIAKAHQEKLQSTLNEIEFELKKDIDLINKLNGEQFKIINELIITLNRTVDVDKIEYLKNAILKTVNYKDYSSYESILLSRIVRDISTEEIKFIIDNYHYKTINIYSWYDHKDNTEEGVKKTRELNTRIKNEQGILFLPDSIEALIINGLVSLGVLAPDALATGIHKYKYTDITVKLLVLLR